MERQLLSHRFLRAKPVPHCSPWIRPEVPAGKSPTAGSESTTAHANTNAAFQGASRVGKRLGFCQIVNGSRSLTPPIVNRSR